MSKSIKERMVDVIVEKLNVDEGKVTLNAGFEDDLGADSLDLVDLMMELEEEFDIEIPDSDAAGLKTVQDALDYLEKAAV